MYSMKKLVLLIVAGFIMAQQMSALDPKRPTNKYVTCDITLEQQQLKAGSTTQLLISFKPIKGIHINGTPAVEVTLDSTGIIAAVGKLEIPKAKTTGYLDTGKRI